MPDRTSLRIVLAFDYGMKRIGVATGNALIGSATPLPALKATDGVPRWEQITALIDQWRPDLLLVGLPLNMDDSESEMSARAARFGRRLRGRFGIRCELMDERLSSFEARGALVGTRTTTGMIDSVAAQLILESWFASRKMSPDPGSV